MGNWWLEIYKNANLCPSLPSYSFCVKGAGWKYSFSSLLLRLLTLAPLGPAGPAGPESPEGPYWDKDDNRSGERRKAAPNGWTIRCVLKCLQGVRKDPADQWSHGVPSAPSLLPLQLLLCLHVVLEVPEVKIHLLTFMDLYMWQF